MRQEATQRCRGVLLETSPWAPLKHQILDETWFLDLPLDVFRSRVEKRTKATLIRLVAVKQLFRFAKELI